MNSGLDLELEVKIKGCDVYDHGGHLIGSPRPTQLGNVASRNGETLQCL
jgi:hypothetical protein